MDLSKPRIRGTKLKCKMREIWIEFRYEQLPTFCYYCGCIGHHEQICAQRKVDVVQNCLKEEQFGAWLRAGTEKQYLEGIKGIRRVNSVLEQSK